MKAKNRYSNRLKCVGSLYVPDIKLCMNNLNERILCKQNMIYEIENLMSFRLWWVNYFGENMKLEAFFVPFHI